MYVFSKPGYDSATARFELNPKHDIFLHVELAATGSGLASRAAMEERDTGLTAASAGSVALTVVSLPVLTSTGPLWFPIFVAAHD